MIFRAEIAAIGDSPARFSQFIGARKVHIARSVRYHVVIAICSVARPPGLATLERP